MREYKSIEEYLILVAVGGVLVATLFVLGGWILNMHSLGTAAIPDYLIHPGKNIPKFQLSFRQLTTFNANNLIMLGILALILSQILRVIILTGFYLLRKDLNYFLICGFVLFMLGINLCLKI